VRFPLSIGRKKRARVLDTATTTFRSAQIFPTNVTKPKRNNAKSKNLNVAHLTDLLVLVHHRVVDGGRHLRSFSSSAFTLSSSSSFKKGGNREKQICVEKFFFFALSLSLSERVRKEKKREKHERRKEEEDWKKKKKKKKAKTTTTKARNLLTTTSSTPARARAETNKQTKQISLSTL
jgi:hypothetical protein